MSPLLVLNSSSRRSATQHDVQQSSRAHRKQVFAGIHHDIVTAGTVVLGVVLLSRLLSPLSERIHDGVSRLDEDEATVKLTFNNRPCQWLPPQKLPLNYTYYNIQTDIWSFRLPQKRRKYSTQVVIFHSGIPNTITPRIPAFDFSCVLSQGKCYLYANYAEA